MLTVSAVIDWTVLYDRYQLAFRALAVWHIDQTCILPSILAFMVRAKCLKYQNLIILGDIITRKLH